MNLFDQLIASADPDAPFMERPDGAVDTYADLMAHTARLANALVARGVKPGDLVSGFAAAGGQDFRQD